MEMLKDLSKVFPNDSDFRLYITSTRILLLANDKALRQIFHDQLVVPYEKKIMERDEAFFLEKDYNEYSNSADKGTDVNQIVSKLKGCWSSLNDENRDVVWKYLHLLLLLDKKM